MSTVTKKQDMPPPGGYKPIEFRRIPARTFFNGYSLIGMYFGMTAGAAYIYYLNYLKVHREEIEQRSAEFALYPMLMAEKDRAYLNQLRLNREEEAKLMANVEGWKVGTWYGEPIYQEYKKDKLIEPKLHDYYVHSSYRAYAKRAYVVMMS